MQMKNIGINAELPHQ